MIKLPLNRPIELEFKLNIRGSNNVPIIRLVIPINDSTLISITGSFNQDTSIVKVPVLNSIICAGFTKKEAWLEAIIDGNYFTPWKDSIEFDGVEVVASLVTDNVKDSPVIVEAITSSAPEIKEVEIVPTRNPYKEGKSYYKLGKNKHLRFSPEMIEDAVKLMDYSSDSDKAEFVKGVRDSLEADLPKVLPGQFNFSGTGGVDYNMDAKLALLGIR